ncbi:hypothetical protein CFC21_008633, partial [Triticum aestivum]
RINAKWVNVPLVRCQNVGTGNGKKWCLLRSSEALRSTGMLQNNRNCRIGICSSSFVNMKKSRSSCVQIRNWFDYRNHICI